jgi:hypothetical protein
MVLLCFLYVDMALSFRWILHSWFTHKAGLAYCRVPLNQTHLYFTRAGQEMPAFGATPQGSECGDSRPRLSGGAMLREK